MVLGLGRYLDVQGKYPVATVADITQARQAYTCRPRRLQASSPRTALKAGTATIVFTSLFIASTCGFVL